jgi:hypothetical protein
MAHHEITSVFVCKDPEWDVTYTEHDERGTRSVTFKIFVDFLAVGALDRWDSPDEPIDDRSRATILERLAAWAFGPRDRSGPPTTLQEIVGPGMKPLRAPGSGSSG